MALHAALFSTSLSRTEITFRTYLGMYKRKKKTYLMLPDASYILYEMVDQISRKTFS